MKILICDDNEDTGVATQHAIEDATSHEVELLWGDDLKAAIKDLFEHARSMLQYPRPATPKPPCDTSTFGRSFDIAVLDNNLSGLQIAGARHTAESIAGYVRAFGNIPYLVSLNKNPQVDFDLRYLVGDYQTQADLAVNDVHLSNPGLWTGDPKDAVDGFLPWYWPTLNDAPNRRREQVRFVGEHLQRRILETMYFPSTVADYLSRHAKGALSPETEHVESVTFLDFFRTSCRSLPNPPDREGLAEATSSSELARDIAGRVIAGEMDRWVRRDLMGGQDVLVDIPHLLMRMPFLLGPGGSELSIWNEAVNATKEPYGLCEDIYSTHLHGAKFRHDDWTKGPCFWWRDLKANAELSRMFYQAEVLWVDVVFCEDSSRFVDVSGDGDPGVMEFAAEFEGSWSRRHIAGIPGKHYSPQSRLAK